MFVVAVTFGGLTLKMLVVAAVGRLALKRLVVVAAVGGLALKRLVVAVTFVYDYLNSFQTF